MARSTFRVLFYANGSKEKNGIVPIMGRVTINFSPLNKSAGKVTMGNTVIRRSVGRTSGLPTDKGKPL